MSPQPSPPHADAAEARWTSPEALREARASARSGWWNRLPTWAWVLASVTAMLLLVGSLVMSFVRLPYYTISPGDALDIGGRVEVNGEAPATDGEVLLLFVQQQARINGWRYIQAKLDDDIDLHEEAEFAGDLSPAEIEALAAAQMKDSQNAAKVVALGELGYEVGLLEGAEVLEVLPGRPAADVLAAGDVILEADGVSISGVEVLFEFLTGVEAGDDLDLLVLRDGEEIELTVTTVETDEGSAAIGAFVSPRYDIPIDIDIDVGDITGPSAGLAMTLSVLDALSPADLTGGLVVAATGTIQYGGDVERIGGIGQKTVSARANGADLMLVPADEVDEATQRAKGLEIVGVADIDDALAALEAAGGEPLVRVDVEALEAA